MAYIASFDIGSSAIKAVLLDQQGGMHHACSKDYAASDDAPGEQQPQLWWNCFNSVLRQWWSLGVLPTSLKALTFSGQMQDMIALDSRGEVVRPAVLYMDARAGDQATAASTLLGEDQIAKITRNPFNGTSVLPKIMHLRDHEPAHFQRTTRVLVGAKDFIIFGLTGQAVTDPTTAATTGMYNFDSGCWASEWLTALGLSHISLPHIYEAGECVGQVSTAAAEMTGLEHGLAVFCGLGDAAATTLGAGVTDSTQSYAYLGTSGWVATLANTFHTGPSPLFLLPCPQVGWHIRIGPISNAGSVHRWAAQLLGKDDEVQGYAAMEFLVSSTATDAEVLFLPYLSAERLPVSTEKPQGSFMGLSLQTTQAQMLRSVLEGVALSLLWAFEEVRAQPMASLQVVGGATRSAAWMQILADVWNKPVVAHRDSTYLPCVGAAATAAVSLGWSGSSAEFLQALVRTETSTWQPNPANVPIMQVKSLALRHWQQLLSGR
ncbi:MAG: FGGY-family carbohydrate kinase [Limnohabitans sp.]